MSSEEKKRVDHPAGQEAAPQTMWSSIVNWFSRPMTILILVALVMLIILGYLKVRFY